MVTFCLDRLYYDDVSAYGLDARETIITILQFLETDLNKMRIDEAIEEFKSFFVSKRQFICQSYSLLPREIVFSRMSG